MARKFRSRKIRDLPLCKGQRRVVAHRVLRVGTETGSPPEWEEEYVKKNMETVEEVVGSGKGGAVYLV